MPTQEMINRIRERNEEIRESLNCHRPPLKSRILEQIGIRDIPPWEITKDTESLRQHYPDLWGERGGIGPDDLHGRCQSWRGNRGWWKNFVD